MAWTSICVYREHEDCPDTKEDKGICDCPCHLIGISAQRKYETLPGFTTYPDPIIDNVEIIEVKKGDWYKDA